MSYNINKNISIWRGNNTPPTIYHLWLKEDKGLYIYRDEQWELLTSSEGDHSINNYLIRKGTKNNISEILSITDASIGDVWKVETEFTLNGSFYQKGTNVVCVISTSEDNHREENWDTLNSIYKESDQEVIKLDDFGEESHIESITTSTPGGKLYYNKTTKKIYYRVEEQNYSDWNLSNQSNPALNDRSIVCDGLGNPIINKVYIINTSINYWDGSNMIQIGNSNNLDVYELSGLGNITINSSSQELNSAIGGITNFCNALINHNIFIDTNQSKGGLVLISASITGLESYTTVKLSALIRGNNLPNNNISIKGEIIYNRESDSIISIPSWENIYLEDIYPIYKFPLEAPTSEQSIEYFGKPSSFEQAYENGYRFVLSEPSEGLNGNAMSQHGVKDNIIIVTKKADTDHNFLLSKISISTNADGRIVTKQTSIQIEWNGIEEKWSGFFKAVDDEILLLGRCIDNLTTQSLYPLTASQGKNLKELIDSLDKNLLNVLSTSNIDLDYDTISKLLFSLSPTRFIVKDSSEHNCGILEVFGDSFGHGLTQIFTTTFDQLTEEGEISFNSHSDSQYYQYRRFYSYSQNNSGIPIKTWGPWSLVFSSSDINDLKSRIEILEESNIPSNIKSFSRVDVEKDLASTTIYEAEAANSALRLEAGENINISKGSTGCVKIAAIGQVSTSWDQISGKPVQFTPTVHTHTVSEITDFSDTIQDIKESIKNNYTQVDSNNYAKGTYDDFTLYHEIEDFVNSAKYPLDTGYKATGLKKGDTIIVSFDYEAKNLVYNQEDSYIKIKFDEAYNNLEIGFKITDNGSGHFVSELITLENNSSSTGIQTSDEANIKWESSYVSSNVGGIFRISNFMINKGNIRTNYNLNNNDTVKYVPIYFLPDISNPESTNDWITKIFGEPNGREDHPIFNAIDKGYLFVSKTSIGNIFITLTRSTHTLIATYLQGLTYYVINATNTLDASSELYKWDNISINKVTITTSKEE